MDRFSIVQGHYVFYANNHTGQGSKFYKRLSKISRYFKPSDSAWNLDRGENYSARYVYNGLAAKYGYPEYSED